MARRRRRTRVPLGFGAGGRAALVQDLLPTASEKAEKQRVQRSLDNQKTAAFNREDISLAELEAYFTERLNNTQDQVEKTEIQVLLDNARAADKKRTNGRAGNEASAAFDDYKAGRISYEDAQSIISGAASKISDKEISDSVARMGKDLGTVRDQREVNDRLEDFNKGTMSYDELASFLEGKRVSSQNEVVREQIDSAMTGARAAENKRVMTIAASEYENGSITFAQYSERMTALKNAPDQKNPEVIQAINDSIRNAMNREQGMEDQRVWERYQSGGMSAGEANNYYADRAKNAKDPKTLANLSQYSENIRKSVEATNAKAEARQRAVAASGQKAAASIVAATKSRDETSNDIYQNWYKDEFKPAIDDAGKRGDADAVFQMFLQKGQMQARYHTPGGAHTGGFDVMSQRAAADGARAAGNVVMRFLEAEQIRIDALAKAAQAAGNGQLAADYRRQVVNLAIKAETSKWTTGGQKLASQNVRVAEGAFIVGQAAMDRVKLEATKQELAGHVTGIWRSISADPGRVRGIMAEAGIVLDAEGKIADPDAMEKFSNWLLNGDNVGERLANVRAITNAGKGGFAVGEAEILQLNKDTMQLITAAAKLQKDYLTNVISGITSESPNWRNFRTEPLAGTPEGRNLPPDEVYDPTTEFTGTADKPKSALEAILASEGITEQGAVLTEAFAGDTSVKPEEAGLVTAWNELKQAVTAGLPSLANDIRNSIGEFFEDGGFSGLPKGAGGSAARKAAGVPAPSDAFFTGLDNAFKTFNRTTYAFLDSIFAQPTVSAREVYRWEGAGGAPAFQAAPVSGSPEEAMSFITNAAASIPFDDVIDANSIVPGIYQPTTAPAPVYRAPDQEENQPYTPDAPEVAPYVPPDWIAPSQSYVDADTSWAPPVESYVPAPGRNETTLDEPEDVYIPPDWTRGGGGGALISPV